MLQAWITLRDPNGPQVVVCLLVVGCWLSVVGCCLLLVGFVVVVVVVVESC